jgi:hypothetical protein
MSLSIDRGPLLRGSNGNSRRAEIAGFALETILLFVICTLDLVSSAWLFHHGLAREANPLLRDFAEAGVAPFAIAKAASFVPALFAIEWYRKLRPGFVLPLARFAIAAYLLIYGLSVGGQFLR